MLPLRQVRQLGAGGECMAAGPAEAEHLMHLHALRCGASDDVNEGSLHAAEGRRMEQLVASASPHAAEGWSKRRMDGAAGC